MVSAAVLALALLAQDPFQPLDLARPGPVADPASARADWVRVTNQRMHMSRSGLRVAQEGLTAVVLSPGVGSASQAKPILLGKGEYKILFKSIVGLGFDRIVVRNPDTGKAWGARLEKGRSRLD